ncbi:cysteine proteinase, partial [Metschnikowia bicuspidata]
VGETPSDTEEAGRIARTWPKSFQNRKPVGLINFGVTCYMNSAIQTMIHIPAVQQYLLAVQANKHKQLPPRSVTHTLSELSARMWGLLKEKHSKYINPKKMVQRLDDINCMMSEWQQEDSHEYFMSLMSRLQEDSTPKGKKLSESVIYDIFGGLLEQEVVCQECKSDSITKQEFYDLSLGFNKRRLSNEVSADDNAPKYSIERAIRDFFSLETIRPDKSDASSGYYCEKCRKRTVATKKSTVEKSPQTLLVHMKRFKFNGNSSLKVKQPIVYQKYLDLGKFSRQAEPMTYQLISVIVHEGRSILSGHYVAHCMQPDGTWATYDDEYINKIDARSALNDPSAYCLLYTKLRPRSKR